MEKFIVLPRAVLLATAEAQVVLAVIASHYNITSKCAYPSIDRIARISHLGENTVHRTIDELEKLGLLESHRRKRADGGDTSNEYRLPWFPENAEDKKKTFIVSVRALLKSKYAKVVLFRLLAGSRLVSIKELSNDLGVDISTVKRAIRELKRDELIVATQTELLSKRGKKSKGKNLYDFPWLSARSTPQSNLEYEAVDIGSQEEGGTGCAEGRGEGCVAPAPGVEQRRKQLYMERYHNFIFSSSWREAVYLGWEDEEEQFQDYIHMLDAAIDGKCEEIDCYPPQLWSKAKKVLVRLWTRDDTYKNKNVKIEVEELRRLILSELTLDLMSYALKLYSYRLAEQPPIRQTDVYLEACIVSALLNYHDDVSILQE